MGRCVRFSRVDRIHAYAKLRFGGLRTYFMDPECEV